MFTQRVFFSVALLLFFCVSPCAVWGDVMKEATLIPQWEPQAQFAGYYVAQAKGFYVRHGVDMTILRGGPSNPPSKLLTSGKAQFGTMFLATAILERSKGLKLMNIAQFMRGSTVLLVVQKESGITRPEDFDGKKVSLWDKEFSLQPEEFFKKYNVEVTLLPQGFTPDLFLRGGVDAMSAMYYNEYHTLLNTGLDPEDLTVFAMADYGLNFAEDGLYCLESTYRDDPELCHAVAEASIEGWVYAHEHPEETLDIVMERVNAAMLPTNRAHQKWMLERMFENIFPDDNQVPPGPLQSVEFDTVVQSLNRAGMLPRPVSFEEFHVPNR